MSDPMCPSASLLVKLSSVVVHAAEMISDHASPLDRAALETVLYDEEVAAWITAMSKVALAPVTRTPIKEWLP